MKGNIYLNVPYFETPGYRTTVINTLRIFTICLVVFYMYTVDVEFFAMKQNVDIHPTSLQKSAQMNSGG